MPKGKKRLTQREKAERAAIKKQLQADGVLPPDKPRLNRKKFAREVWEDFSEMDVYTADFYLRKAIMATVGPDRAPRDDLLVDDEAMLRPRRVWCQFCHDVNPPINS